MQESRLDSAPLIRLASNLEIQRKDDREPLVKVLEAEAICIPEWEYYKISTLVPYS